MGIEISAGKVGMVRGVAWPGTRLGVPYAEEQAKDYFGHSERRDRGQKRGLVARGGAQAELGRESGVPKRELGNEEILTD